MPLVVRSVCPKSPPGPVDAWNEVVCLEEEAVKGPAVGVAVHGPVGVGSSRQVGQEVP